jgi:glycogen operon protein
MGPTLCFRGIDNAAYYRLSPDDPRYYVDFTGCGNTLNMTHPRVLQIIMDSLRYWAVEMHVDGFRFDLASTLARELHDVDRLGAFFDIIHQDPILSQTKLIAEPWDVGPGGYQVGNFPPGWSEWNGKYRDTVRQFWKGDGGLVSEIATRLAGSSDLYQNDGRRPYNSINFITCHDGFTLADLVSFNTKHNDANQEQNRDGADDNHSWNCGVEGSTDDPAILSLRARQKRNLIATLLLSQGVPMILGGDELGHTQLGNNNTYCQDSPLNWLNWNLDESQQSFLAFVKKAVRIWMLQPVFQRRKFFKGRALRGSDVKDISFFSPSGSEMSDADWNNGYIKCMGVRLAGDLIDDENDKGEPIVGETLLLLLNAHHEPLPFALPITNVAHHWQRLLDTGHEGEEPLIFQGGENYLLKDRSLVVLSARAAAQPVQILPEAGVESLLASVPRMAGERPALTP